MNNKYPLHLEKMQEKIYVGVIDRLTRVAIPKLKKEYKQQIKVDADNFGDIGNKLLIKLTEILESEDILLDLEQLAYLVDSWAMAQTKQSLRKIKTFKKSMIKNIFTKEDPFIEDFIKSYVKKNKELISILGHEYIPEITQLTSQTYIQGGSIKTLATNLQGVAKINKNKAMFWARDQMGDAYASFTKIRQTSVGISSYIWRTVEDNHVRDTHAMLEGRKFTWTNGAASTGLLARPGAKHPSEDWNCRCSSEAVIDI